MKEIYKIGGYVRVTKAYDWAKVGDILQIHTHGGEFSHPNSVHVNNKEGNSTLLNTHLDSSPECEWYGMEAPVEKKFDFKFGKGDWVVVERVDIDGLGKQYYKIGDIFQILDMQESISKSYQGWIWKEKGKEISSASCRKARPEEISGQKEEWTPKSGRICCYGGSWRLVLYS